MYIQHLANIHTSTASIKNYLSGARHWVTAHLGDPSGFNLFPALEVLAKVTKDSAHVPLQALPLVPADLKTIVRFLDGTPNYPLAVKPCLLISYACMLRSSNVVSPSTRVWGGAHTLKAYDVLESMEGLDIIIRSTKTTSAAKQTVVHIDSIPASMLCPVQAWRLYYGLVSPPPTGPAFLHADGSPLTAGPVVSAIRAALKSAGYMNVNRYSMHSLRRGATQLAANLGAPPKDIMEHGIWSSRAGLAHYVDPSSNSVPRLIAHGLAQ